MEENTFEAVRIATNVMIFMVAVTAAFTLMGTINDMVEYTKETVSYQSSGSMVEHYGDNIERTYTGAEILSLYGEKLNNKITADIKVGSYGIEDYVRTYISGNLHSLYELSYNGEDEWVFTKI